MRTDGADGCSLGWIATVLMLLSAAPASADPRCLAAAKTDLERLYCEVVDQGAGAGLPSQPDFNRNDPRVQGLLLKRPAARLGLAMPEPVPDSVPAPKPQRQPEESAGTPAPSLPPGLANCDLAGEQIRCPQSRYLLADNRHRSALQDGALGPDNRLQLASFQGSRGDREAVRRYLSAAYDQYILKMLGIGLGANTMSFTAFHNAFHTLESGGVEFAERMAQTYELLKQDRRTLGVKTRYHDDLPASLSLCIPINPEVIVCDNVGTNWVFVRSEG